MEADTKNRPAARAGADETSPLRYGRLDFYDGKYGFITPDGKQPRVADVFLRWTVAKACRVRPEMLVAGRRLKYRDAEGTTGPSRQATFIDLA